MNTKGVSWRFAAFVIFLVYAPLNFRTNETAFCSWFMLFKSLDLKPSDWFNVVPIFYLIQTNSSLVLKTFN